MFSVMTNKNKPSQSYTDKVSRYKAAGRTAKQSIDPLYYEALEKSGLDPLLETLELKDLAKETYHRIIASEAGVSNESHPESHFTLLLSKYYLDKLPDMAAKDGESLHAQIEAQYMVPARIFADTIRAGVQQTLATRSQLAVSR